MHQEEIRNKNRSGVVVYLVGFTGELAATKLALDLALGAVVLQVVGQVAARQLDGATIGARYNVEGAGGEVALRETRRQRGIKLTHEHTHPHVRRQLGCRQKTRGEGEGRRYHEEMFDKAGEIKRKHVGETDEGKVREDTEASHLQLLHLAGPAAALLAVDAADRQRQDLLLQLRVRVDLREKSRTRSQSVQRRGPGHAGKRDNFFNTQNEQFLFLVYKVFSLRHVNTQ